MTAAQQQQQALSRMEAEARAERSCAEELRGRVWQLEEELKVVVAEGVGLEREREELRREVAGFEAQLRVKAEEVGDMCWL